MTEVHSQKRPSRRERAEETRARMIEAAHAVFLEQGYAGARMTDIAAEAGVAVQTLYYSFNTKASLLQACFDSAVLGPEKLPPPEKPFWADIAASTNGKDALAAFARGNGSILVRVAGIHEVAIAAKHEPEAVAILDRSESMRRSGYTQVVGMVAERGGLRKGLTRKRAIDTLLVIAGPSTYRELTRLGWRHEAIVAWQLELMTSQLLG